MRRSAENRERLVHAAAELFWRSGYAATSLADVAAAADVPVGNVYYYFQAKAALAEAVAALMDQETGAALATIDANHQFPSERITALIDLLAASNPSRTARGCPIAAGCKGFREHAPEASRIAAGAFQRLRQWLVAELVRAGLHTEPAGRLGDEWLARWQGSIALSHALGDPSILDLALSDLRREAAEAGSAAHGT